MLCFVTKHVFKKQNKLDPCCVIYVILEQAEGCSLSGKKQKRFILSYLYFCLLLLLA